MWSKKCQEYWQKAETRRNLWNGFFLEASESNHSCIHPLFRLWYQEPLESKLTPVSLVLFFFLFTIQLVVIFFYRSPRKLMQLLTTSWEKFVTAINIQKMVCFIEKNITRGKEICFIKIKEPIYQKHTKAT